MQLELRDGAAVVQMWEGEGALMRFVGAGVVVLARSCVAADSTVSWFCGPQAWLRSP